MKHKRIGGIFNKFEESRFLKDCLGAVWGGIRLSRGLPVKIYRARP